jgi:HAD superfamily hydrolase (TIGR01509 family)
MIEAVIFDMDGVLIDSEPFWREAEIAVFQQVDVQLTNAMCLQTKGLRIDEVVAYWYRRQPWETLSQSQIAEDIVAEVIRLIQTQGEMLGGVREAVAYFKEREMQVALASSSAYRIIHAVLEKLGLETAFEVIYSAQDEPFGKPHPGVYITTAQKLGVTPAHCLAIEDSLNGVLAAKSAQMTCIAVPEARERDNPKFAIADYRLDSLTQIPQVLQS